MTDQSQLQSAPDQLDVIHYIRDQVQLYVLQNPDALEELLSAPNANDKLAKILPDIFTADLLDKLNFKIVLEDMTSKKFVLPVPSVPEDLSPDQLEAISGGAFFIGSISAGAIIGGVAGAAVVKTAAMKKATLITKGAVVVAGTAGGAYVGSDVARRIDEGQ